MKKELKNWKNFLLQEDCWDGYERVPGTAKGAPGSCRKRTNEDTRDTYDSEVVDRNKKSRQKGIATLTKEEKEEFEPHMMYNPKTGKSEKADTYKRHKELGEKGFGHEKPDLLPKVIKALRDEGGAAGMDALKKHTGASKNEIDNVVDSADNIKVHEDGDYILMDSLNEEEELLDENGIPLQHIHEEGKICPKGKAWAMRKYGKWSAYAAMGASKYCKDPNYGKGKKKKKNESIELDEGELAKWRSENWVQSDGTPCGDAKAQKNPKRCKPASKWSGMSKSEKKADDAKKKAGGKKGKQFVSATKKGKVTKGHTKESMEMNTNQLKQIIREVLVGHLEEGVDVNYYHIVDATYDDGALAEDVEFWDDVLEEAEYQGRKVTLNKPMQGDVKKSKVYVKDPKTGNVKKVNFGDPNMKIKKSNPKRRKSFRARHNCDNPGPKTKARYWSCRAW
jgi:hypothetical protein